MAHSNTSDNWGTAAVTVQQSSAPDSIFPTSVLYPTFPVPIRKRREGQYCWCTSWTVIFPPVLHSQNSAESPVTQLWGGTVPSPWEYLNSSLCTPAHSWASPSTQHSNSTFPVSLLMQHQKLPDPCKKEHLSQQVSWAPQEVFALPYLQISSHLSGQPGHSSPPDVNARR